MKGRLFSATGGGAHHTCGARSSAERGGGVADAERGCPLETGSASELASLTARCSRRIVFSMYARLLLFSASVVAGCGPSVSAPGEDDSGEDPITGFARSVCGTAVRCGCVEGAEEQSCVNGYVEVLEDSFSLVDSFDGGCVSSAASDWGELACGVEVKVEGFCEGAAPLRVGDACLREYFRDALLVGPRCEDESFCDGSVCREREERPAGSDCGFDAQCEGVSWCVMGSCSAERVPFGGACEDSKDCESVSDFCQNGVCSTRLPQGSACLEVPDCAMPNTCRRGTCQLPDRTPCGSVDFQ